MLADRLRDLIASEGPITFAQFMEHALYDPDQGFYAELPIGSRAHYVTSPHVSSCFGDLLAVQVEECAAALPSCVVVEAGAGDGTLAEQIRTSWRGRYVGVDRSAGARGALEARGIEASGTVSDIGPYEGVVLANELLDNVPFHRLRRRGGRLVEVFVGFGDDGFVEVEGTPSPAAVQAVGAEPGEGEERPASPGWRSWVRDVAGVLVRGWVFLIDYGFVRGEGAQSVRGYADQRVTGDVLRRPGSRDISTGVDFDVLAEEAKGTGMVVWGPVSQRDALNALGFRRWMDDLRKRQARAEAAGDHRTALRLFAERSRAPMLVDPAHLGALKVVAFGRGVDRPRMIAGE